MSTQIENNTEELQNILQTVYNLPNAGGGFSIPVIDCVAMGFPGISEDIGNSQSYVYDEYLWDVDTDACSYFMSEMKKGIVKLRVNIWGSIRYFNCLCSVLEGDFTQCCAAYSDVSGTITFCIFQAGDTPEDCYGVQLKYVPAT